MSTCGKRGCCCCCNKRDLTVLFGFILAAIAVAVPIVIHETDQEYGLTVIKFIRQYLGQNEVSLPKDQQLNNQQLNPHQKYKYASDLHYIYCPPTLHCSALFFQQVVVRKYICFCFQIVSV